MNDNHANPFQSPSDVEAAASAPVPSEAPPPKPWSLGSLCATALMLAIVGGSMSAAFDLAFAPRYESDANGMAWLMILQGMLSGYWLAAGSGHLLLRLGLGTILLSVLYWEVMQTREDIRWMFVPICMGVVAMTAILDAVLAAIRGRQSQRFWLSSAMLSIGSLLVAVVYVVVQQSAVRELNPNAEGNPLIVALASAALGSCMVVAGSFLLIRKHALASDWHLIGIGLFLLVPAILGIVETWRQGSFAAGVTRLFLPMLMTEAVCWVLIVSAHRMLRSFGGSLIPHPSLVPRDSRERNSELHDVEHGR